MIPYGFCGCGCGQKTNISRWANKYKGLSKGQHLKFRAGHNRRLLKNMLSGTCIGCGKTFEVSKRMNTRVKYCSQECYGHNHWAWWRAEDWQAVRKSRRMIQEAKKLVVKHKKMNAGVI